MNFFTPELYIQFNSSDVKVANQAEEEWEQAIEDYRHHLKKLKELLPQQAAELTELCLHDADLLSLKEMTTPIFPLAKESDGKDPMWSTMAVLSLKQDDRIIVLFYILCDHIRYYAYQDNWPFSKQNKHWLYDELNLNPINHHWFFHRILFSDGEQVQIPFINVFHDTYAIDTEKGTEEKLKNI